MSIPRIPQYRLHKASGQARVIFDGRHVYLGKYGTPESQAAYARLIAERFTPVVDGDAIQDSQAGRFPDITVSEVLAKYIEFASRYYVNDGQPTKELTSMKEALGSVRLLYGSTPAADLDRRNSRPFASI